MDNLCITELSGMLQVTELSALFNFGLIVERNGNSTGNICVRVAATRLSVNHLQ